MKKSLISNIIVVFLLVATVFSLVACSGNNLEESSSINNDGNLSGDVLPPNTQLPSDFVPPLPDVLPPANENPNEPPVSENPEQSSPVQPPMEEVLPELPSEDGFTTDKIVLVRTLVSLNVRSSPSTSSTILGVTDAGDCLPFLGERDGFYQTIYKNQKAYVSNNVRYSGLIYFEKGNEQTEKAISIGQTLLGFPYVYGAQRLHYGGAKPVMNSKFVFGEFDCSSLVQYMFYKSQGISLQVTTRTQYADTIGERVNFGQIVRGDVLYFTNASRKNKVGIERIGHVAVYLGVGYDKNGKTIDDYILHTATDHAVIEPFSDLRKSYFEGGIRIV